LKVISLPHDTRLFTEAEVAATVAVPCGLFLLELRPGCAEIPRFSPFASFGENLMAELAGLWLPILVSAIAVFFASFLAWVVIGHHHPDWNELPDEGDVMGYIQKSGIKPGLYLFPMLRSKQQMVDPGKQERMESGPWGTMNIMARQASMGRNLMQTFTFYLVTSVFIAYLGTLALDPGADFSKVFQVTGTAGILAYAFGSIPNAIWFGSHLRPALMDVIDGICFGLVTGAVFGFLWP
jgi:hypothetical protein